MPKKPLLSSRPRSVAYQTALGVCLKGKAEQILQSPKIASDLKHKVDLIFTSPPFPLTTKKKYGNLKGNA
jgi:site-specific DNA-methyltransferase (cytosine-N4-specific)